MNKKIILLLICAIFLTLGAVSAADNVTDNAVSVDHSTDNDIADVEENDILNTFNDDTLGDFGSYEELKEKIDEFEKIRYDVQILGLQGKKVEEEKNKKLQEMYTILTQNKEIKEYFDLEVQFNVMIADVNKIIAEAVKDVL